MTRCAWALGVVVLAAGVCSGGPLDGITSARHDLELGFEINGVVAEVAVEAGQQVGEGAVLIRLSALDAEAQLAQLRIRAESTHEMDAAYAEWQLGKIEHEQMVEAHRKGGATEVEVKRAALEVERDRLRYELLKQRREEARLQLRQAEVNLERYVMRAPRDGIVEDVGVSKGEPVREVTPVLRFVDISLLRVEVPTPTEIARGLRVGGRALVDLDGAGQGAAVEAAIIRIAAIGDPASGLRTVVLEFPNPEGHAAGEAVKVEFAERNESPPSR